MTNRCIRLSLVFFYLLSASPLIAQSEADFFATDSTAPIQITSDYFRLDHETGDVEFANNMRLSQGPFILSADQLTGAFPISSSVSGEAKKDADRAFGDITMFRASGNVEITSANGRRALGQWATYDLATDQLVMGDQVVLINPEAIEGKDKDSDTPKTGKAGSKLQGGQLFVDMRTGIGRMTSTPDGGRVRGVFTPGSRTPE